MSVKTGTTNQGLMQKSRLVNQGLDHELCVPKKCRIKPRTTHLELIKNPSHIGPHLWKIPILINKPIWIPFFICENEEARNQWSTHENKNKKHLAIHIQISRVRLLVQKMLTINMRTDVYWKNKFGNCGRKQACMTLYREDERSMLVPRPAYNLQPSAT
jgi:hypothetical protein